MKGPKSFILYLDLLGSLDQLNDAQAGKLFKAIKAYHMSVSEGATQDCKAEFDSLMEDFVTRLAFHPFRASFERDAERYQAIVDRNRKNGKNRWKEGEKVDVPKIPVGDLGGQNIPSDTNGCHNDNDNDNDNDKSSIVSNETICQATSPDVVIVPYHEIMDFWNKAMQGKAIKGVSAIKANSKRATNVRARIKEYGIEKIYQAIINASESDFLNGRNSRGFTATFDWVFLPSNFIKVLDNNYHNSTHRPYEQPTSIRRPDANDIVANEQAKLAQRIIARHAAGAEDDSDLPI